MSEFSVLKIGYLKQRRYAFYDVVDPVVFSTPAITCPKCGASLDRARNWAEPRIVDIKQPRCVGDLLYGAGAADFIASKRFVHAVQAEGIEGIGDLYPIQIRRMGTRRSSNYPPPELYGLELVKSAAQPDFGKMEVVWSERQNDCPQCSTGGPVWWSSYERIVIDDTEWNGEDIFYATGLPGIILLSEDGKAFIEKHEFTNCTITPCSEVSCSWR